MESKEKLQLRKQWLSGHEAKGNSVNLTAIQVLKMELTVVLHDLLTSELRRF